MANVQTGAQQVAPHRCYCVYNTCNNCTTNTVVHLLFHSASESSDSQRWQDKLYRVNTSNKSVSAPEASRMTLLWTVADSSLRLLLGHHPTQCTAPPSCHVLVHLPVRTSHKRRVPSSEPEASHWPVESGATQRTCSNSCRLAVRFLVWTLGFRTGSRHGHCHKVHCVRKVALGGIVQPWSTGRWNLAPHSAAAAAIQCLYNVYGKTAQ